MRVTTFIGLAKDLAVFKWHAKHFMNYLIKSSTTI